MLMSLRVGGEGHMAGSLGMASWEAQGRDTRVRAPLPSDPGQETLRWYQYHGGGGGRLRCVRHRPSPRDLKEGLCPSGPLDGRCRLGPGWRPWWAEGLEESSRKEMTAGVTGQRISMVEMGPKGAPERKGGLRPWKDPQRGKSRREGAPGGQGE